MNLFSKCLSIEEHNDFERHMAHVLSELERRNTQHRQAYFTCVLVLIKHQDDPCPMIAEGRWYGEITKAPEGDGGFGYDPLFYVADQNATAAQMNPALKNEQSHRGKACQALLAQLQDQI